MLILEVISFTHNRPVVEGVKKFKMRFSVDFRSDFISTQLTSSRRVKKFKMRFSVDFRSGFI